MGPFEDHFSRSASIYRKHRPTYPRELVDWVLALPGGHALAWDAGCGSGQLSVPLSRGFRRVIASDASAAQLTRAPVHPRVRYVVGRSESSALASGVADLSVAAQAAHWFDIDAYFAEVERVGRPGGHVVLICYGRPALPGDLDNLLERFHRQVLGPFWPRQRRHVEQKYRSLPFPFPEVPAPAFEMKHLWGLARFRGYVETWSAVRALDEGAGPGPLRAFFRELAQGWGGPGDPREVRWPITVRVGRL